ncbi:Arylsulfatase, partial [Aspergillus sp. HF37]
MKLSNLLAISGLFAVIDAVPTSRREILAKKPNILFIMTDDLDLKMNSPAYMPHVMSDIKGKGVEFANHFVTTTLCCPSRVSLLTGKQAHNTNVTNVSPPWGGYPKFVERGLNEDFLPVWLQNAGYNTYYAGKLMNGHGVDNYNVPHVNGFNSSDFLLDPYTYSYLNSTYQRNHDPPVGYEGHYTTDVTAEKTLGFLEDALESDRPFFLATSPIAPHANIEPSALASEGDTFMTVAVSEPQYEHLFQDAKVPRTRNFNPKDPTGANWIKTLPLQNQTIIDYEDHYYRQRLRSLQSVDDLVNSLIKRLERSGQLENTYIIFTSDNGYHIGQHRLAPGKSTGFEEDIRVPFYIRGPGVSEGGVDNTVTTHIDLAPTFFELAGIQLREDFDGTPMRVAEKSSRIAHEHVTVEYWGSAPIEGKYASVASPPGTERNTYKSIRILGEGYNLYYSVWCSNEHELYDLANDPYEIHNLYHGQSQNETDPQLFGRDLSTLVPRLDALLMVLKSCKGNTCIKPWGILHPDGSVQSLTDSMDERYDKFYEDQPKVSY